MKNIETVLFILSFVLQLTRAASNFCAANTVYNPNTSFCEFCPDNEYSDSGYDQKCAPCPANSQYNVGSRTCVNIVAPVTCPFGKRPNSTFTACEQDVLAISMVIIFPLLFVLIVCVTIYNRSRMQDTVGKLTADQLEQNKLSLQYQQQVMPNQYQQQVMPYQQNQVPQQYHQDPGYLPQQYQQQDLSQQYQQQN